MNPKEINVMLQAIVGKTVDSVVHVEKEGYDDWLTVDFTDKSRLIVTGCWCNDSTGGLSYEVSRLMVPVCE